MSRFVAACASIFLATTCSLATLCFLATTCHAQHLWWDLEGQNDATCLYGTITVLATHRDIYYCGANWHPGRPAGGYCGIQHNSEKERRTIFSVWDTSPELHPRATEADPETPVGRFGGEGEGEHTHLVWPWEIGETVQFHLQKQKADDGKSTDARYYIYDRQAKQWRHVSTIRSSIGGQRSVETIGGGLNSFLENFSGKAKDRPKVALYRLWLGKSVDALQPLTKARGDGLWGQLDGAYFLAEGADDELAKTFRSLEPKYGKPAYARVGEKLPPLKADPVPEAIVAELKMLPRADTLQEKSDDPRAGATYVLSSAISRKVPVAGRDGAKMVQSAASKSKETWKLKRVDDGFQIVNAKSGLVLDGSGDQLSQRRSNGAASQKWSFVKEGIAYYVQCQGTGRVLDVEGGSVEDGVRIVMWSLKKPPGHANQMWMLREVKEVKE